MTQKNKLAKEYSETVDPNWNARLESQKAWLAGFEKARQLMLTRDYISTTEAGFVKKLGEWEVE